MNPGTVCICTVAAGPSNWLFTESVFTLKVPGLKLFRHIAGKQGVDDGHNRVIEWFLEYTDFEWLLHLDDDAKVHHETLLRLLSWGVKFVSALAFQRLPPFAPVVYTSPHETKEGFWGRPIAGVAEWIGKHPHLLGQERAIVLDPRPDDALWEVNRGGAHCLLTHRSVLEAIEPPWFNRTGKNAKKGSGSDFWFHGKAKEAGFKTYVDMSVVAGHTTGDLVVGALDFMVWNTVGSWDATGSKANITLILPDPDQKEE